MKSVQLEAICILQIVRKLFLLVPDILIKACRQPLCIVKSEQIMTYYCNVLFCHPSYQVRTTANATGLPHIRIMDICTCMKLSGATRLDFLRVLITIQWPGRCRPPKRSPVSSTSSTLLRDFNATNFVLSVIVTVSFALIN